MTTIALFQEIKFI